jgi:hypothetical protein
MRLCFNKLIWHCLTYIAIFSMQTVVLDIRFLGESCCEWLSYTSDNTVGSCKPSMTKDIISIFSLLNFHILFNISIVTLKYFNQCCYLVKFASLYIYFQTDLKISCIHLDDMLQAKLLTNHFSWIVLR